MRVLLINPWAVNNDEYYTSGFISGMSNYVELDVVSNYYFNGETPNGKCYKWFFKKSEKMQRSSLRLVVRALEYLNTWRRIERLTKNNEYEVIHIHWLLVYIMDLYFLKRIKRYCRTLILAAHNVLPHIEGEKSKAVLQKVYGCFSKIVVHGDSIKKEFEKTFPQYKSKLIIQYHGEYVNQSIEYSLKDEAEFNLVRSKIKHYKLVFIEFGSHFYNKGTDRLLKIWLENYTGVDSLLIVAGKMDARYTEMKELLSRAKKAENILVIDHYIDDNLLNFSISSSDVVIIPYRHASMSGVVFTAAAFSKVPICTKSGAIAEYLEDGIDSFLCDIDDAALKKAIDKAMNTDKSILLSMGKILSNNIKSKYSWNRITRQLYQEVYTVH